MAEAVGPQFVMAEVHKRAAANKNPKARPCCARWARCACCASRCAAAAREWTRSPSLCSPPPPSLPPSPLPTRQVLSEALGWVAEAVPDFGLAAMDVGAIIEWMKADLGSPNAPGEARRGAARAAHARVHSPTFVHLGCCRCRACPRLTPCCPALLCRSPPAVRTRAMEVLGRCHAQLGPSLSDFLEGLKPAQLMALEEHFKQNPLTTVGCVAGNRGGV